MTYNEYMTLYILTTNYCYYRNLIDDYNKRNTK